MTDSEPHTDPREELRETIARQLFAKGVEQDLWNNIHEEWDLLGAEWHDELRELADATLLASEQFTIGLRDKQRDSLDVGAVLAQSMFTAEMGHTGLTWEKLSDIGQDEWTRKAGHVLESWWRPEEPLVVLDLAEGEMWWETR